MRTSLISTVAAIALIGASAPFAAQAGPSAPEYQMAAGEGDKQSGEMRDEQGAYGDSKSAQSGESKGAQPPARAVLPQQQADQTLADDLIGTSVRTAPGQDGEEIGTVNDLVLDADNRVTAVVIGVGGFLGVGEKNVAVTFDQLEKTQAEGRTVLIANLNRAQLEQAPEFVTQEEKARQQPTGQDQQGSGSSGMSSQ